jgi:hypothetical protein
MTEEYTDKVWTRIGWLGATLVLLGYYLNANMSATCWPVWIAGNAAVGLYCLRNNAWPTAMMSLVLVIMNIYGYIKWSS